MMTINVQLDDDLARKLAAYAQRTGQDLQTLVQETLHREFSQEKLEPPAPERPRTVLPTYSLGVKPGIDISNNAQVRDIMDEGDEKLRELYGYGKQ